MDIKQNKKPSFMQNLYTTLVSMKFAIIILIILGATSLLSMLINEYPDFFKEGTLIHQLFNQHSPYSSWWYSILLWFLIISVFLCVIQNIGPTFRSIFRNNFLNTAKINELENSKQFNTKNVNIEQINKLLKKQLFSIDEKDKNGEKLIVARKFKWSSLGHILTHISLLVIVIGSLIYTKTHRQEFRYIIAQEFNESEYRDNFPELFEWHFAVDESFHPTMVVDSFRVRFYDSDHGPNISDFRSYVRVFDHDGTLITKHEITVNSPLILKHISIHQTDYKPLVNEFFRNVPDRSQIVAQAQRNQEFIKNETNWITGLSLRGNKGKTIIFVGMLISAIGLTMAFMFWPRYVWLAFKDNKITIAGRSVKNKIAFEKELDNLIERIKNE
jgi:cytochrome c biogenesis protein ResB